MIHAQSVKTDDDRDMHHWYAYQGDLGEVVCNGRYFFALKDGCLIGTSKILEEVMEALAWKERLKTRESKRSIPNSF
jgi:hypothetical protein